MLLGVDIGTSSIKAVLTDRSGFHLRTADIATPWQVDGAAVTADPAAVVAAARSVIDELVADLAEPVAAVGVTGVAESGVLLDGWERPVGPVIAWHDQRGAEQEQTLRNLIKPADLQMRTGQFMSRRLTAVKYRWLLDDLDLPAGAYGWCSLPELLVHELGGSPVPDLSQWSRTGFLSIADAGYDEEICEWAGLNTVDAPSPAWSGTPMGRADRTVPGALRGATLTTAGHDHVCAAFGAGARPDVDVCDSWGNGEALVRSLTTRPDVAAAAAVGFSVSWGVNAPQRVLFRGFGSGLTLRRALAELGRVAEDHADLDAAAEAQSSTARVPATGAGPASVWRASLDRIFDELDIGIADVEGLAGPVERVLGCGGWLLSEPIVRMKSARVRHFTATHCAQPAALGAALLGGIAASNSDGGSPHRSEQRQRQTPLREE